MQNKPFKSVTFYVKQCKLAVAGHLVNVETGSFVQLKTVLGAEYLVCIA